MRRITVTVSVWAELVAHLTESESVCFEKLVRNAAAAVNKKRKRRRRVRAANLQVLAEHFISNMRLIAHKLQIVKVHGVNFKGIRLLSC
jgi:hypothetical protein